MKFRTSTQAFLQALQLVSRAISGQQALPILGSVLIDVKDGVCTLSATDLELSIITTIEAEVELEGSITVPSKSILNFVQYNSDPEVTIEKKGDAQLFCTSSHAKTTLSGEKASEYPKIASVTGTNSLSFDAATLLEALHLVTFTAAKTSLRPVLSGVSLRQIDDEVIFAATDSYRLSEYRVNIGEKGQPVSCIIPVKVLDEVKSVLSSMKPSKRSVTEEGEKEGARSEAMPVALLLGDQQIEMKVGDTRLLSRLIEGNFPDYKQIIPKDHTTKALMSVAELTTAVKRMHYFAKEVNNNLTFSFTDQSCTVTTPQTTYGKDEAMINTETTGTGGKIALSSSYLLDFLGHLSDDSVDMRISDSQHPAVFHLPTNDRFLHLIMPLRMQESAA